MNESKVKKVDPLKKALLRNVVILISYVAIFIFLYRNDIAGNGYCAGFGPSVWSFLVLPMLLLIFSVSFMFAFTNNFFSRIFISVFCSIPFVVVSWIAFLLLRGLFPSPPCSM